MPIPILVVMAILGLVVYLTIGGVFGAIACRVFEQPGAWDRDRYGEGGYQTGSKVRWLTGEKGAADDGRPLFVCTVLFWPAAFPLGVLAAVITGVAYMVIGIATLPHAVGRYTARALTPKAVEVEAKSEPYEQPPVRGTYVSKHYR